MSILTASTLPTQGDGPQRASRFFHAPDAAAAEYARIAAFKENAMNKKTLGVEHMPIRDLADFHLRWSEFRDAAVKAGNSSALPLLERETIQWLIRMADRIGSRDIGIK
jgi:hypothetical protein